MKTMRNRWVSRDGGRKQKTDLYGPSVVLKEALVKPYGPYESKKKIKFWLSAIPLNLSWPYISEHSQESTGIHHLHDTARS